MMRCALRSSERGRHSATDSGIARLDTAKGPRQTVSPARSPSVPTRRAARLLDPLVQLWSLCLLQSGHLDVSGPVGGSKWRWGVEVCTAEEDDVHGNVVGGQLDDP